MFKLSPFKARHLAFLDANEVDRKGILADVDAPKRIEMLEKCSVTAHSFYNDCGLAFCGGAYELWPGVLELWLIPSVHIRDFPVAFCKEIKRYINGIINNYKCHRIQATTLDDPMYRRFLEFLGMVEEGVMHKYTPNQDDFCMFARTF